MYMYIYEDSSKQSKKDSSKYGVPQNYPHPELPLKQINCKTRSGKLLLG